MHVFLHVLRAVLTHLSNLRKELKEPLIYGLLVKSTGDNLGLQLSYEVSVFMCVCVCVCVCVEREAVLMLWD